MRRGARVVLTDTRPALDDAARLRDAGIELELGGHARATFEQADLVVVSPGVPMEQKVFDAARGRGAEIIGELELASRWVKGPIVAITGTKGKSTTTTLLGRMLKEDGRDVLVGGNIGVPLSAQVDASSPETVHVVEVSSFQLETTVTLPPVDCAVAQLRRRPPRSASDRGCLCGREGPYLRESAGDRLGGRECRRPDGHRAQSRHRRAARDVFARRGICQRVFSSTVTGL